jgi:H-type lectin domain
MVEKVIETIVGALILALSGWVLTQVLTLKQQMLVLRRQRIELGQVEMPKYKPEMWDQGKWVFPLSHERSNDRREEVKVEVPFKQKFRDTPRVEVALAKVDLGDAKNSVYRVEVEAKRPTPEGFDLYFRTWSQSLLFGATAIWIAAGDVIETE